MRLASLLLLVALLAPSTSADDYNTPSADGLARYGCDFKTVRIISARTHKEWTEYRVVVWAEHQRDGNTERDWNMFLGQHSDKGKVRKWCNEWLDAVDEKVKREEKR